MKTTIAFLFITALLFVISIQVQAQIELELGGSGPGDYVSIEDDIGTILFKVTGEGNVGIGTDTPAGILDVQGGALSSGIAKPINLIAQDTQGGAGGAITITSGNGDPMGTGGDITITAGGGISNSGDIILQGEYFYTSKIILENTHEYAGGSVEITGGDADYSGGDIDISAGTSQIAGDITITAGDVINESNPGGYIVLTPGSSEYGPDGLVQIIGSGCYTGSWGLCSDERFKRNINDLEGSLNSVLQLRGVNFEFKTEEFPGKKFNEGKQIGLIAQEVEKVFPEFVRTDDEGYKSVAYQNLTTVLIEAIKEQQQQIENLSQKIETLRKEINGEVVEVSSLNK